MLTRLTILLCLCTLVPPARAGIEQFIDDQTTLAAEVNLTKADPDAIDKWVSETFKTAQLLGPVGPGPTEAELRQAMDQMKRWVADAKAQGATVAYAVAGAEQTPYLPFVVIVPVADAQAKPMASLLFSGSTTGPSKPETRGQNPAQNMGRRPIAEEVPGVGAMFGVTDRINAVKKMQPKPRPDLDAAFKAAGTAPAKVAIAPTAKLQANMRGAPMPVMTFIGNTKWVVAAVNIPPKPGVKITLQAKDAEAAKQLQQMIVMYAGMGVASGVGLTPEFTQLLTPNIQGDQVIVSLDEKQLLTLAGEMKGPMLRAKQQAQRVASMSNMRQILMGCHMYSAEQKGAWPDDLKGIEKFIRAPKVFVNPMHPDLNPAYVYLKPAAPLVNSATTAVLYESHTDFGDGVGVGFADGHVEFVANKEKFDELLAGQGGL